MIDVLDAVKKGGFNGEFSIISDCSYSGCWVDKSGSIKPKDFNLIKIGIWSASSAQKTAIWGLYSQIFGKDGKIHPTEEVKARDPKASCEYCH